MRRALSWLCLALMPTTAWAAHGFTLDSPTLKAGASMPLADVYTQCGGGNQSPQLMWHDLPAGTQSFAVTMFDPDAVGGFWHWIAFNIPVGAQGLNADAGAPHSGNAPGDTVQLLNFYKSTRAPAQAPAPAPAPQNGDADAIQQRRTQALARGTAPNVRAPESTAAPAAGNQGQLSDEDAAFLSLVGDNPLFR